MHRSCVYADGHVYMLSTFIIIIMEWHRFHMQLDCSNFGVPESCGSGITEPSSLNSSFTHTALHCSGPAPSRTGVGYDMRLYRFCHYTERMLHHNVRALISRNAIAWSIVNRRVNHWQWIDDMEIFIINRRYDRWRLINDQWPLPSAIESHCRHV